VHGFYHLNLGFSHKFNYKSATLNSNLITTLTRDHMMTLAESLGSLLKRYGLPRTELAAAMDVSIQTIHNWCIGRVPVPVHQFGRLSESLTAAGASHAEMADLLRGFLGMHGLDDRMLGALSSQRRNGDAATVLLMSWDIKSGGLFSHFPGVCRSAVQGLGMTCLVVDCGGDHQMKRTYVNEAIKHRYAGVILAGIPGAAPAPMDELFGAIQPLINAGIPVVMISPWNADVAIPEGVAALGWDSNVSNSMALSFLREAGHERIAVVLSETGPMVSGRYQGLDRTFSDQGARIDDSLVVWTGDDPDDPDEIEEALGAATAIFARPSTLHLLANGCYARNMRWPDDISIITVGHPQSIPQLSRNPFTYVSVPVGRISRSAAHILASLVEEGDGAYYQQFAVYGQSAMRIMNADGGSVGAPMAGK
jgi:DNA-binding LacI/PurR family transcriptional regulator